MWLVIVVVVVIVVDVVALPLLLLLLPPQFLPEFSDQTSLACVVVVVVHMHPLILLATDMVRNTRRLGEICSVGDHLSWLPKCRGMREQAGSG